MPPRNDIAPDTLDISLEPEGVEIRYTDGRSVFYHGVPTKIEETVTSAPGKDVHVLVTDPTEEAGVVMYINDRTTADEILESSGVGRIVVDRNQTESLFPGVEATNAGYRIEVDADPRTARGRVFVFTEDELGESSYEIVAATDRAEDDSDDEAST